MPSNKISLKTPAKKKKRKSAETPFVEPKRPQFLGEFHSRCIKSFDVTWIVSEIASEELRPAWFRKVLMLMLLGWVLFPERPSIRLAMAWHYANEKIHASVMEVRRTTKVTSYFLAMLAGLAHHTYGIRWVYRSLGGLESKKRRSWNELRNALADQANRAEPALFLVDVMVAEGVKRTGTTVTQKLSLKEAKTLIRDWGTDRESDEQVANPKLTLTKKSRASFEKRYFVALNKMFVERTLFSRKAISYSTFREIFPEFEQGFEFVAALFSMVATEHWSSINVGRSWKRPPRASALHYIANGEFDRIPLGNRKFQLQMLGRAKFFARFLTHRENVDPDIRFASVNSVDSKLNIYQPNTLSLY